MERTSKASAATAFYLTAALNQLFGNVTHQSLWVSEVTPFDFGNAYSFFRYATQTLKIMRHPSGEIEAILGYVDEPELIHRDNLVLL